MSVSESSRRQAPQDPAPSPPEWSSDRKTVWVLLGSAVLLIWSWTTYRSLSSREYLYDFVQEWTSARNFFSGKPIYWSLRESVPHYFGGQAQAGLMEVNAHPPPAVLMCLPLGMLDYFTANFVWGVLSLGLLAASVWLLLRPRGLGYSPWAAWPVMTLLLVSSPLAQQVIQGQLNLLLLALIAGAWAAQRQQQPGLSGALVGAGAAVKLFPAFLVLYFLAARQWKAVAAAAFSFVAINGLTLLVLGGEAYKTFLAAVLPEVTRYRDFWLNASLTGFWTRLFHPASGHVTPLWESPAAARIAIFVSSAIVVALTAAKTWSARTQEQRDVAFGLCVTAMLLVSPITWDHYFVILTLPLLVFWKAAGQSAWRKGGLAAVIVALGVLRPALIWNNVIPGDGELASGPGATPSVAEPIHALTVLAYPFYALAGLFLLGLFGGGSRESG